MSDDGFLLINKPPGKSSFDIVKKVRYLSRITCVGHAGTLDPFASGLLILGLGRTFTKQLSKFQNLDKLYTVRIVLGIQTDTLDSYGKIVNHRPFQISRDQLHSSLTDIIPHFLGKISQTPPLFSAKKVNGKPLYKYARQGKSVTINPTFVHINRITIQDVSIFSAPLITLTVHCSKGTYIRTLAKDIATKLGTCCFSKDIIRLNIGPYSVQHALLFHDLSKDLIDQHVFTGFNSSTQYAYNT